MNCTSCSLYERGPPLNTFPVCVTACFQIPRPQYFSVKGEGRGRSGFPSSAVCQFRRK